ncbi:AMP-binding protein [Pseudooceanicola sp. CBS1P-1]|uniref:AMP-binding protein n=1 Tax=Pseudooceanicola albus TaxID=2692189 RepID=A0A6L7GAP9_9RHOB|nr:MULTISPECIES: AMP-binding protein [Pseudooceanicola]MBT9386636.1 AMP-binding protein [Pseudooceanicola endophyticus]MXN20752.1 AMP-binding protein [Pseudooceanicola albus]
MTTTEPLSFGARLRQLAAERGAAEALRFLPASGPEQVFSWAALNDMADGFARALSARGVGQGDVVGFALGNIPAHVALAVAIWRVGATTMVLDPGMKAEGMAAMKARSKAALVIAQTPGRGDISLSDFETLATQQPATEVPDRISTPGKIVLSGGSTGLPKMMCDDRPFTRIPGASWGRVAPRLGFRCDQVQLVCGAMSHNAPFTWAQNGLFEGNRLVLMERFDALRALQVIDRYQVGFAMLVPTMMVRMHDRLADSGATLDSLHALYHTGAPCAPWLKRAWIDTLGPGRVTEMYGSGENTGQTTITGAEWLAHPGSVGRGFETEIRIYSPEGTLLPAGEAGEIFMRPDDLGGRSHYAGPDAPRPERDADGFQSIGDVGWLDGEGYLYLGGRRDDVINTGGVKVHPETVEAVLLQHPAVADAVVFGATDREWGQRVIACIEAKPGTSLDPGALRQFCATRLSPQEVPKQVALRDTLPRDGFGKIRRKAIARDWEAEAPAG